MKEHPTPSSVAGASLKPSLLVERVLQWDIFVYYKCTWNGPIVPHIQPKYDLKSTAFSSRVLSGLPCSSIFEDGLFAEIFLGKYW